MSIDSHLFIYLHILHLSKATIPCENTIALPSVYKLHARTLSISCKQAVKLKQTEIESFFFVSFSIHTTVSISINRTYFNKPNKCFSVYNDLHFSNRALNLSIQKHNGLNKVFFSIKS